HHNVGTDKCQQETHGVITQRVAAQRENNRINIPGYIIQNSKHMEVATFYLITSASSNCISALPCSDASRCTLPLILIGSSEKVTFPFLILISTMGGIPLEPQNIHCISGSTDNMKLL